MDGPNVYAYVGRSPINNVDFDGLSLVGKVAKICVDKSVKPIGDWLRKNDLIDAVKQGDDVIVRSQDDARDIAKAAGDGKYRLDTPEKPQRPHYHPLPKKPGGPHVFFQWAGGITGWLSLESWTEGTVLEWPGWTLDLFNPLSLPNDVVEIGDSVCSIF